MATKRAPRPTPAPPKVTARVMDVDPDQALTWLDGNVHNRPLRPRRVEDLVGVIQRGEWQMNADAVRFDGNGTLLDGQHRLWAVAESGATVPMLVVRGLSMESQETMDMGARRNLKDVLALRKYRNAGQLAAVVNYWWRYENGWVRTSSAKPTVAQAIETLEANPTLVESMETTRLLVKRYRYPTGVAAAANYEFNSISPEEAGPFFDGLLEPKGLPEGSPILAFRRWVERRNSGEGNKRADAVVFHALLNKAWNAYRDGHPVERLVWKATGMKAEGFPEAR